MTKILKWYLIKNKLVQIVGQVLLWVGEQNNVNTFCKNLLEKSMYVSAHVTTVLMHCLVTKGLVACYRTLKSWKYWIIWVGEHNSTHDDDEMLFILILSVCV